MMADRTIKVLENNRLVTRGVNVQNGNPTLFVDEDESLPVTIDWSGWLGSDTISSVTNESHGPGVSGASNTTTTATFTISATQGGYIEHRITTAAGSVKELRLIVNATWQGRKYDAGCW